MEKTSTITLVALVALLFAERSEAYVVNTADESGIPTHWEAHVIPIEMATNALTVDTDKALEVLRGSARAWESIDCHTLSLAVTGTTNETGIAIDRTNRVVFQAGVWFGSPDEVALTRVTSSVETGEIVDADILFNERDYTFAIPADPEGEAVGFAGVMTHEVGHLLGLAHTDFDGATMEAVAPTADTTGIESLSLDDIVGACHLYEPSPLAQGANASPLVAPAESSPRGTRAVPVALGLLGLLVLFVGARRRPGQALAIVSGLALLTCADDSGGGAGPEPDAETDIDTETADTDVADAPDAIDGTDSDTEPPNDIDAAALPDGFEPPTDPVEDVLTAANWWSVREWTTVDLNDDVGADMIVTPHELDSLWFRFAPEGDLFFGRGAVVNKRPLDGTCGLRATWEVESDHRIEWTWATEAQWCPGRASERIEVIEVLEDTASDEIQLRLVSANYALGKAPRGPRVYRVILSPQYDDTPAGARPSANCEEPPESKTCELACDAPSGPGLELAGTLTCAPNAIEGKCLVQTGADTDPFVQSTCQLGCYAVTCRETTASRGVLVECQVPDLELSCER